MNLCVVGLGRLGGCLAVSLATAGHRVFGVDLNPDVIAVLEENRPNPEPGLNDLLALPDVGKMLTFGTFLGDAVDARVEMTFVVVPTPSKPDGSFDTSTVEVAVTAIDSRLAGTILVVCSTVSPGTMERLADRYPNLHFVYSPLFIALGSVLADMRAPDFRLVGAEDKEAAEKVTAVLSTLDGMCSSAVFLDPGETVATAEEARELQEAINALGSDLPDHTPHHVIIIPPGAKVFYKHVPVKAMGLAEAEVTKLAVNAGLVLKASYANTIAMACQTMPGVDARVVLNAVGVDHRIGSAFLSPGSPPGGPCLGRDAKALHAWLSSTVLAPPDLAYAMGEVARAQLLQVAGFFDKYRRVAILGRSYKPGTPVSDGSFGLAVAARLTHQFKTATVHDPYDRVLTVEETLECADAVLVATPHEEYRALDTSPLPTLDMWGICKPGPNVTVWGKG